MSPLKNWCKCFLYDFLFINMGQSPISDSYNENQKGLPFYQGKADFGEMYPKARIWCTKPQKTAKAGDILLSVRAPVGSLNMCREESCIGRGLAAIRGMDNISNKFVFYLLEKLKNEFIKNSTGTTFLAITGEKLKNITVMLPPLAEQGRIVEKIEQLFAEIDAGVESLKNVKNQIKLYRQSVLKNAFEGKLYKTTKWSFEQIGKICEINPKTTIPALNDNSPVSFLPMPAVMPEINHFIPQIVPYSKVKKGYTKFANLDVLFAKITPCMENGKSCVVHDLLNDIGFGSTEFHVLRPKEKINPLFVFYFIVQPFFRTTAIPFMTGAVGQKRIPADYLRDYIIPVPTLAEQERIVAEIEKRFKRADAMETAVQKALDSAEKLKQSVLKKAFRGELVAQNPNDEPASVLLDRIRAERAAEQKHRKKGKQ